MISIRSIPVDTSRVPSYFNCFPVYIHKETKAIDEATMDVIQRCATPGSKEYKQAVYRHSNPLGNPYALLCNGGCDVEKLKCFVKVIEMLWIVDDVAEELAHKEAVQEYEVLRQGLHQDYDSNMDTGKTVGTKKAYLREVRDGMLALDPVYTPALLETLDRFLEECDSSEEDFKTLEEYLPYRIPHAGHRMSCHFTWWAMDIHLTDGELEVIREFEWTLGSIIALTNDYISWRKEKWQPTDRVRNAVPLLMRQYSLKEKQAKLLLKGIIIEEEERAKTLRMELEAGELSDNMKRYINALEVFAGGICYWSVTCPRYNKPQEESDEL